MLQDPLQNLIEAGANSPLTEAEPLSLNELMERAKTIFNKDPRKFTDNDIEVSVAYFRTQRSQFAQLAKEKENQPKKSKSTNSKIDLAKALKQSLDNIEL